MSIIETFLVDFCETAWNGSVHYTERLEALNNPRRVDMLSIIWQVSDRNLDAL